MLQDTKRDLMMCARKLSQPYESYSIDALADAYCEAVDTNNATLKDVYISALILRFWSKIDKMYKNNTVAPCLEYEDFFWWLYEAIEYACKYRGWKDPTKKLNAQQCINKCIDTIKLQKYYDLRLDKKKTVNYCTSMDTPVCGGQGDDAEMTIADTIEDEDSGVDMGTEAVISLVQSYINRNKIIEAILIDNIAFNDVNRYHKKTIKTENTNGEPYKYVEYSSEFWSYRLVKIVGKLPESYKKTFMARYSISEEKLDSVLNVIDKSTNQKLYRYLDKTLADLRVSYVV
jgi:hypothetical protein